MRPLFRNMIFNTALLMPAAIAGVAHLQAQTVSQPDSAKNLSIPHDDKSPVARNNDSGSGFADLLDVAAPIIGLLVVAAAIGSRNSGGRGGGYGCGE